MKFSTAFTLLATSVATANAQSIVQIAQDTGSHNTLVALVTAAGLGDALSTTPEGSDGWTVFAPTDTAFAAVDAATVERLQKPEFIYHLQDVLTYHAVTSPVMSTDLSLDQVVSMANGGTTTITSLTPPTINTAVISGADVPADNGVVHVTDGVLVPPSVTTDIVGAASGADAFSTLVELVAAADLVGALQGPGPYTVFAPTNDAFALLDADTVATLKTPEGKDQLTDILTYHVYEGIIHSQDLAESQEDITLTMLNGDTLVVKPADLMVGTAKLGDTDILVSNGIIHSITSVLMPPADDEMPETGDAADDAEKVEDDSSSASTFNSLVSFALVASVVAGLC